MVHAPHNFDVFHYQVKGNLASGGGYRAGSERLEPFTSPPSRNKFRRHNQIRCAQGNVAQILYGFKLDEPHAIALSSSDLRAEFLIDSTKRHIIECELPIPYY